MQQFPQSRSCKRSIFVPPYLIVTSSLLHRPISYTDSNATNMSQYKPLRRQEVML